MRSIVATAALLVIPALANAQSSTSPADSNPLKLRLGPPGAAAEHDAGATVFHVDKAPELVSMPAPRTSASQTGVGGAVRLRFVVDSTGKVEPASVEVVSSTNQAFTGPAIDALLLSRWRPAELNHQRVRASVVTSIPIKG